MRGSSRRNMAANMFESIGKFGLALAVVGGVVNSALYNVDVGHRAAVFDSVEYRTFCQFIHIFTSIGEDYDDCVLPFITTKTLKSVVAHFDAGELITQTELVSRQMRDDLTE
ncbi:Prohibitin [Plecturocebus cupreus]